MSKQLQPVGIAESVVHAVSASRGHFRYESGHHGDLWLDLDALFVETERSRRWAQALARQATSTRVDVVCGPMAGGALLAQLVAVELGTNFAFAERTAAADGLVQYRIPGSLRSSLNRRRVLLVDDAVNAGSALLSTVTDLLRCRAELVGLACLLTLGEAAGQIAKQHSVPLSRLATLERGMWQPNACPLCAAGMPLTSLV